MSISNWSLTAPPLMMTLGVLIWCGAAWLSAANWLRSGRRPVTATLEGLRLILVTLLIITLFRPENVRQLERSDPPEIMILADGSGSMQTRDMVLSNRVVSRADWLQTETDRRFWQPLETEATVVFETFASGPNDEASRTNAVAAPADGTDIDAALEAALKRARNLKAVLLLSDGDWNVGRSPVAAATRFRQEDIPIFTVAVGRESPVPDLALGNVSAPSYGLFGEQISIGFQVQNNLARGVDTVIYLRHGDEVVATKRISLPAQSELQDVILWSPRQMGDTALSLEIPLEPDESLMENNRTDFNVEVRIDKLKVLVVDSLPRWEYRYLRNALARDPGVDLNCVLFHPELGRGGGRFYLDGFPGSKELLSRYDVVFLGDVGIGNGELTVEDADLLRGLVEQQASGLVFIPGRRGRQLTLLDSDLKDLIPVILDETKPGGVGLMNESQLLLSSLGRGHFLTRFDSDESRNAAIWQALPGFYWSAAVEKNRPGSEVLAVHSSLRNAWGRMPVLVIRSHGNGKVLFMGSDSAWRWRRGVEDKYHYRFWSQVVRWMAHQRHLSEKDGIRLTYSPESPSLGDTIYMQATVLDAAGFPVESGTVNARVTGESGRAERLEFTSVDGGWGVFQTSFVPREGGKHRLEVTSPEHRRTLETEINVDRPVNEEIGQPINSGILREIAEITRGAPVTASELTGIVEQLSLLPERKPQEKRLRLWSEPAWGGFLLLMMGIYWTGRKLAGMV